MLLFCNKINPHALTRHLHNIYSMQILGNKNCILCVFRARLGDTDFGENIIRDLGNAPIGLKIAINITWNI